MGDLGTGRHGGHNQLVAVTGNEIQAAEEMQGVNPGQPGFVRSRCRREREGEDLSRSRDLHRDRVSRLGPQDPLLQPGERAGVFGLELQETIPPPEPRTRRRAPGKYLIDHQLHLRRKIELRPVVGVGRDDKGADPGPGRSAGANPRQGPADPFRGNRVADSALRPQENSRTEDQARAHAHDLTPVVDQGSAGEPLRHGRIGLEVIFDRVDSRGTAVQPAHDTR